MTPLVMVLLPPTATALVVAVTAVAMGNLPAVTGAGLGAALALAAGTCEIAAAQGRRTVPAVGAFAGSLLRLGGILAIGHSSPIAAVAAAPALVAGLIAMPTAVSAAIARKPARA